MNECLDQLVEFNTKDHGQPKDGDEEGYPSHAVHMQKRLAHTLR